MGDKELVEVWRAEFESLAGEGDNLRKLENGQYIDDSTFNEFYGFCKAKRSQPSVVLPKRIYSYPIHARKEIQDSLTAAGIKYTIGE